MLQRTISETLPSTQTLTSEAMPTHCTGEDRPCEASLSKKGTMQVSGLFMSDIENVVSSPQIPEILDIPMVCDLEKTYWKPLSKTIYSNTTAKTAVRHQEGLGS